MEGMEIIMSKYEMAVRISQIQKLVEERKYKKAAAVLATIDVRQVKSQAELQTFAEVYVKSEQFEAAKAIYLRLYQKNQSKKILYRLIYLAIRTNHLDEAEGFYEEFLKLNHSEQESLVLRYRIDKAKGASFNRLIETLEKLKEEDYVEEWAYELAKLYQRADRKEECRRECEDIKLWFGEGEIVERAGALLEYLDGEPGLYYEDRDYTIKPPEEPNPDDTGSLPDLSPEIMKQEIEKIKKKKKEEKRKIHEEQEDDFVDDYEDEAALPASGESSEAEEAPQKTKGGLKRLRSFWKRGGKGKGEDVQDKPDTENQSEEQNFSDTAESKSEEDREAAGTASLTPEESTAGQKPGMETEAAATLEDDDEQWRPPKDKGMSEEMKNTLAAAVENVLAEQAAAQEEPEKPQRTSQSGMGITQDLAQEITAIFEAEQQEQLKEKSVVRVDGADENSEDVPNLAADVLGRMTQAVQSKAGKTHNSIDISQNADGKQEETADNSGEEQQNPIERAQRPAGMEEIVASGVLPVNEEEVTMIELDQIMPEPDIPELKQVIPEDSPELGNLPELEENELPTTKALHHSFDDILTLIAGELEPKHFVLMGEGEDRILGITKKIVRVNHQKGFLSTNQIARIHSEQLNNMDLLRVCNQIKGSCLLIDEAAELSFPTITKIFAVMDAFRGDFTVVLADDGNTLDELFRVAPALARRFEYVIDISQYGEEDYQ